MRRHGSNLRPVHSQKSRRVLCEDVRYLLRTAAAPGALPTSLATFGDEAECRRLLRSIAASSVSASRRYNLFGKCMQHIVLASTWCNKLLLPSTVAMERAIAFYQLTVHHTPNMDKLVEDVKVDCAMIHLIDCSCPFIDTLLPDQKDCGQKRTPQARSSTRPT